MNCTPISSIGLATQDTAAQTAGALTVSGDGDVTESASSPPKQSFRDTLHQLSDLAVSATTAGQRHKAPTPSEAASPLTADKPGPTKATQTHPKKTDDLATSAAADPAKSAEAPVSTDKAAQTVQDAPQLPSVPPAADTHANALPADSTAATGLVSSTKNGGKQAKVDDAQAQQPLNEPAAVSKPEAAASHLIGEVHVTAQAMPVISSASALSVGTPPIVAVLPARDPASSAIMAPARGVGHTESSAIHVPADPSVEQGASLLRATPNILEVGVASDAHGWLKIRAEVGATGEVAASVQAGSAQAAESVRKELPGMAAYLAHEQVGVDSLVVTRAQAPSGAGDAALDHFQRGSGDARSGGQPRDPLSEDADPPPGSTLESAEAAVRQMPGSSLTGLVGVGGWLSVLA